MASESVPGRQGPESMFSRELEASMSGVGVGMPATEDKLHDQLNKLAYLVDGVTAIIESYIMYADELSISRQAPVLVDTLERVNLEISQLATKFQPTDMSLSDILDRLKKSEAVTGHVGGQGSDEPRGRQLAGTF